MDEHWRKCYSFTLEGTTTFPFKVEEVNQLTRTQQRDELLVELRRNFLKAQDQLRDKQTTIGKE